MKHVPTLVAVLLLASATIADAAITSVLGGSAPCTDQPDGQRHCAGIFTTFDGAPIDVNVGFPPVPASGPDGDFPIVGIFHGWGGSKIALTDGAAQEYLDAGYAVFSMSDRGWGMSCGGLDPKRLTPACATGYNHLMDTRYEVRDAQEAFEALADQLADGALANEGLIAPTRIAAMGGSYGGGMSMALGALKNRQMMPDGSLVPWVSAGGKPLAIAAAQPDIPWTDLAYALTPNGHTLDYVTDAPYLARGRIGVMKQSFVAGLYGTGLALGNYALPGLDPDADLTVWFAAINAGEPYDANPLSLDIVDETTRHHSSYYIDDSTPPAPLLISNGWTDDLFPVDEALRFYNRTRTNHPGTPIALVFTDHGHQRGQNKAPDAQFRSRQRRAWLDFYVRGIGPQPFIGVQTLTQTCGTPSGGATGEFDDPDTDLPFAAPTWAALAPGEIRHASAAAQTVAPTVPTDLAVGQAYDPITGGGACATADAADQSSAATYRLDPAPAGGFTLMGSPTVVADIASAGPTSQLAARLLDVDPVAGTQTLVARGLYRPEVGATATRQVFQLHPNGWTFAEGHVAKLELLPADAPYGRVSNGQLPITVSNLELRLPVVDEPGCGLVQDPAPKVVPAGYTLATDYADDPSRCASCPLSGCRLPTKPGKGTLAIKDKPGQKSDRLQWTWAAGAATAKADFGNPAATPTDYTLCVYDGGGNVVSSAHAPGGGSCDGKPCWKETGSGFKYRKRDLAGSGLVNSLQVVLKAGAAGKAKIGVIEKGGPVPTLPLAQPARVQLVNGAGICWEAGYGAPALRSDASQFKDKND